MTEPLLRLDGITKRFPGVIANADVSLDIERGEIHALLGENGAGKSTLVKMIYGIMRPDAGTMWCEGREYRPGQPADARAHGIGIVFQHFSLFEALTVAENIVLGLPAELVGAGIEQRIIDVSTAYGLKLDPSRLVGTLSVGERQRVEIVRCLLQSPRLLIMDEPTSVLTPPEVDTLFTTLRRLAAEGCAILYISHKLEEIRALCTHATILRAGRVVAACDPRNETARSLAELMIGTPLMPATRVAAQTGPVRLAVSALSMASEEHFGVSLLDISFDVKAGEILGIAGVAGNGQTELMEALIGERPSRTAETIEIDGAAIGHLPPQQRRARGMGFVPEERLGHGAVPDMSLADNTILSSNDRRQLFRHGLINQSATRAFASDIVAAFDVRSSGVTQTARSLSGGNLQKFIMGREILQSPSVLIVSQPTWGVDAGATAAIHEALLKLAREGAAVVVISQDLDELFALSSRIAVIAQGRLTAPVPIEAVTIDAIGRAMGGAGRVETGREVSGHA